MKETTSLQKPINQVIKNIEFHVANQADIFPLLQMINMSYRPKDSHASWSNESNYMTGDRINEIQLLETLQDFNSAILIGKHQNLLVSCVLIEKIEHAAKIGLLTVGISHQQLGYGKAMLKAAEDYALSVIGVNEIKMHVLQMRSELMDFYLRRGYGRTGIIKDYPAHLGLGRPLIQGLKYEILSKKIFTQAHQHNNPLHGITLKTIVNLLVTRYGWTGLAECIPINCFTHDPSVNSSLKFLRKTQWAHEKVEALYLNTINR